MARLLERLETAGKALERLDDIMAIVEPDSVARDAAIQRFEFTFEAIWKAAKNFLAEHEGIDTASPKGVIRYCREIGVLTEAEAIMALKMADDRNLTVHTYNESLAIAIYERIASSYHPLLKKWLTAMVKQV